MNGGRVLVVDDDVILRTTIAAVLEDEGYVVEHAGDGVDALAKIGANPPDVILLDVLMPRMNGKQLLETLHEDTRTTKIPVLMMTAIPGFDAHRTIALGASDIVEKPFDADELLNKIALAVYRARAEHPTEGDHELAEGTQEARVSGSRGVILVVDDDQHVVAAFDQLLSRLGYTTVSMSQVSDDLPRLARVLEPRAILLDLRLPALDGVVALTMLRAERELDGTPILVFSASYRELDRRRAEIEALGAAALPKGRAVGQIERFLEDPPAAAFPPRP